MVTLPPTPSPRVTEPPNTVPPESQSLLTPFPLSPESLVKNKRLTAVDRYRLRKRNPFPTTIWGGEKTVYCLKKSARDSLTTFFAHNPYPSPDQKRALAHSCELSYVQISNWFKNKRMREKEGSRAGKTRARQTH